MSASDKLMPAEQRWLDAQRAKWVPLSERQATIIRNAFRAPVSEQGDGA